MNDKNSLRRLTAEPKGHNEPNAEQLEEYNLICQIRAGERELYRILVERYQNMIFYLILKRVNDFALAEDLTQEAFVRAYRNLESFKFQARFSTWLTRIALNHCYSHLLSKQARQRASNDSYDPIQHELASSDDEKRLEERFELKRFTRALFELPLIFRAPLVLYALGGKSYQITARELGIPVGTVRSRISKARLLLQQAMHT